MTPMAKARTKRLAARKKETKVRRHSRKTSAQNGESSESQAKVPSPSNLPRAKVHPRLFPTRDELKSLYQRYSNGAAFDDHDKAFYFVLDVGGISRALQLIRHVEEVLAELEDFRA